MLTRRPRAHGCHRWDPGRKKKAWKPSGSTSPGPWVFGGVHLHTGAFLWRLFQDEMPQRSCPSSSEMFSLAPESKAMNGGRIMSSTYMRWWIIPVISSPAATPITLRAGGLHARQISDSTQMCSDTCYHRTSTSTCGTASIPTHFHISLFPSGPSEWVVSR